MQINIGTHEIDYLVERSEIEIRTIRVDQGSSSVSKWVSIFFSSLM